MADRVMIFIPAYNCEKQLPRVVAKIDARVQALVQEVVIIDNRSADGTLEAAKTAVATLSMKATVLRNKENYNLGGSIKRAFLYAMEHGYDYMIVLHGDDQADIRDMVPVLETGKHRDNDLVIGARFHPDSKLQGYSLVRTLGNRAINIACSLVTFRRVYDMIAGINCFKIDFFRANFFLKFPDNLTFDAHVLLYAFNKKAHVTYIPVTWREEDQISNAKVVRQALIVLRLFLAYVLRGAQVFYLNQSGRPDGFHYESDMVFQK